MHELHKCLEQKFELKHLQDIFFPLVWKKDIFWKQISPKYQHIAWKTAVFCFMGSFSTMTHFHTQSVSLLYFQGTGPIGEDMFESMEEFQMVLNELVGDKSMDKVRVEYEKLIHALKKSRENEKRLMSKCRELNAEIVSTTTKVAAALKISQEDETTITSLKRVYVIFKTCDVNIIQIFFLSLFIYCPDLIWQI